MLVGVSIKDLRGAK
eukprot:symbB.v1.2.040071.t1/scaffold6970.1/size14138/1